MQCLNLNKRKQTNPYLGKFSTTYDYYSLKVTRSRRNKTLSQIEEYLKKHNYKWDFSSTCSIPLDQLFSAHWVAAVAYGIVTQRLIYIIYNCLANGLVFLLASYTYKLTPFYWSVFCHMAMALPLFCYLSSWAVAGISLLWQQQGASLTLPFFFFPPYLCFDFPPRYIMSGHWLKQLYLSINKKNT